MGKYIGSPWGQILGKLDDVVGGKWKGINWNRVRVIPTNRGTLLKYRLFKEGDLKSYQFSYPQMNVRVIMKFLGYIGRLNLTAWIIPIWQTYATKHNLKESGLNVFVRKNLATLLGTMDRAAEYTVPANAPDLAEMLVSEGDLEPISVFTSAIYTTGTGVLALAWEKEVFGNGLLTDKVYAMIARKPILQGIGYTGSWEPALHMYGPIDTTKTRTDEAATVTLPAGLTAADLTAYLFCLDAAGTIGYGRSVAVQVTAP